MRIFNIEYSKILYPALLLVGIVFLIYVYLGGLERPKIELVEVEDYDLVGSIFEGDYKAKVLEEKFFAMRHLLETKQVEGVLTIVNYPHKKAENGTVKQFIGILVKDKPDYIPDNLSRLVIPAMQAIRVTINSNYLVMPSPEDIKERAYEYAKKNNLELQDISIEEYFPKEGFWVEFPLKVK